MGLKEIFVGSGMNTMTKKIVGSVLRQGLTWAAGAGFILASDAENNGNIEQLAAAVVTIGTLLWSMWEKRQARRETVQALAVAQMSENEVKALVANPVIPTPSVFTPPNVVPAHGAR